MKKFSIDRKTFGPFTLVLLLLCIFTQADAQAEWPQWGGSGRNFVSKSTGLAASWSEKGPRQLWSRALGEGHSSILVDGDMLYTMYSRGEQEAVIALAASTGKTIWELKYDSPTAGVNYEQGFGPHATPLLVGDLLYTVGSIGKLHAIDKKSGEVVWSQDLYKDLGGRKMGRGYSCSPLAYKNTIILTLGGPGQTFVAFNQKDGKVVWKNQSLELSPASPIIINVDGQDQHGGSRVLKLTRKDGKTIVEELWFHRRLRVHHSTAIRIGDFIYASSGDFGPAFFSAVNVKTGEIAFQDRSFSKSNFVYADGKLIILDEDGNLALATVSPAGLKVISKVSVMKNLAWTVPTLVGTKLYLRDRRTITALDLS